MATGSTNQAGSQFGSRLQRLHDTAGRPSYVSLVRRAARHTPPVKLSTASIGEWLTGVSIPSSATAFAYMVSELQARAAARAAPGFTPFSLADWERLREAAWAERHARRGGRPASGSRGATGTDAEQAEPVGAPLGVILDPFAFDIHPAIAAPSESAGEQPTTLPHFIERTYDREIQKIFAEAQSGSSRFLALVGGPLTGKSRSLWEALHSLPQDWRVWQPLAPSPTEALLVGLPEVAPRTVVWLTDAEQYLLTPGSDDGERIAAQLREMLRDTRRSPVLVVATLWPNLWATLTDDTATTARPANTQARALLTGRSVEVPPNFCGADLTALKGAARIDPRLAEAQARAVDGRVVQYLAGGPIHLERYKNAGEIAGALITAAIDLRRAGHSTLMPRSLITDAARGYLTNEQARDLPTDWHENPIDYCTKSARGIPGPLSPTSGDSAASGRPNDGYLTLSTYLEHVGRSERERTPIPEATWNALERHSASNTPVGRRKVAAEAHGRCLLRRAYRLYSASARLGDGGSAAAAARILREIGRADQATALLGQLAADGVRGAHLPLAADLLANGRVEEGLERLQLSVTDDDPYLLSILTALDLMRQARISEQLIDDWICELIGIGNFPASMYVLARGNEHGERVRADAAELKGEFHPEVVAAFDEVVRSGWVHLDALRKYEVAAHELDKAKTKAAAAETESITSMRALRTREAFEAVLKMYGAPLPDATPEDAFDALAANAHNESFALTGFMHVALSSGNTRGAAEWMHEKAAKGGITAVAYASILYMLEGNYSATRSILEPHVRRSDLLTSMHLEFIPLGYTDIALDWLEHCSHFAPLWFRRAYVDALRVDERYEDALQIYLRECETASEGAIAFSLPMIFHSAHGTLLQAHRPTDARLLKTYGLEAGGHISSPWGIDG